MDQQQPLKNCKSNLYRECKLVKPGDACDGVYISDGARNHCCERVEKSYDMLYDVRAIGTEYDICMDQYQCKATSRKVPPVYINDPNAGAQLCTFEK